MELTLHNNIPDELKRLKQWVCAFAYSKAPMQAYECVPASSTNPSTWSTFDTALAAVSEGNYDYCGFVFADNGYVGIDIDDGYDEDGFISQTAANIMDVCKSYTERSKSGRGFHIIVKGDIPFKGRNNLAGVEIYKTARYFIMTGDVRLYPSIVKNQQAIDTILQTYFKDIVKEGNGTSKNKIYSPIWEHPRKNHVKIRPTYPKIPDGCRNICLTSLAGMMHTQGYSKLHIYNELKYCNEVACSPPVSDNELQTICNSVTRYKR